MKEKTMTIKSVSALELRTGLNTLVGEMGRTGVPFTLVIHGKEVAGVVPPEWATVIDRIVKSEQYGADSEVPKAVLRRVLESALLEATTDSKISLSELVKKLAEYVTAVQKYHGLLKSLKFTET